MDRKSFRRVSRRHAPTSIVAPLLVTTRDWAGRGSCPGCPALPLACLPGRFSVRSSPGAASGEKAPSRLDHRLARSAPELKRIRAGPTGCVRLRWRVRDRLNEPLPARRGCSGIGNHSGLMMASLCEKFDVQHKHPPNAGTAPATGTTGVPCCTGTTWRRSPSGGYEGAASNDRSSSGP